MRRRIQQLANLIRDTYRKILLGVGIVWLFVISGCSSVSYYHQAVSGHLNLLASRTPNETLIQDSETHPRLVAQLKKVERLKQFAEGQLGLPADGQYSSYVDTGKRYVVWNVFAAPALSLDAKTWCYLVIGCAAYRGLYDKADAEHLASKLRAKGLDVYLGGTVAYSTLGWFEDPVLNTFVYRSDAQLADLLFHELAHQRLYINGDSQFNESYASFVAREGVRRWFTQQSAHADFEQYQLHQKQHAQFIALVTQHRQKLEQIYTDSTLTNPEKLTAKEHVLTALVTAHEQLKTEWGGKSRYERWFSLPLNNAQLNTVSTYNHWVPAFQVLLDQHDGDLESFYTAINDLRKLSQDERETYLTGLMSEHNE